MSARTYTQDRLSCKHPPSMRNGHSCEMCGAKRLPLVVPAAVTFRESIAADDLNYAANIEREIRAKREVVS